MSNSIQASAQSSDRQSYPSKKTSIASSISTNAKTKTSTEARPFQQQPSSDSWTSTNTSLNDQTSAMSFSSSQSAASSSRGSPSMDSMKRPLVPEPRRSSMERAMDKAKNRLGRSSAGAETLPNNELEYERQRAKAMEKQQRKAEYERLGLKNQTRYGTPGGMSFGG